MKKKCWTAMAAALALAAVLTGCGKETQRAEITASAESAVNTEPIETNEEMETESVEETLAEETEVIEASYEWEKLEEPEKGVATVKEIVWYLQDCNTQEPKVVVYSETRDFSILNIGEEYVNEKKEYSGVYIFYPGKLAELSQSNEDFHLSNVEEINLIVVVSPQYGSEDGEDIITIITEEGQKFQISIKIGAAYEIGVGKVATDWVTEE